MSDMAKQARAAMKAKAKSLTSDRPLEKVDSSTWTPPALLNADVKTGMRPVSRRAYKSGGKVQGAKASCDMGRKPRQSGGKAITADSLINRNAKEANQDRDGIKHIGGLKTGGRAKKMGGGPMMGDNSPMQGVVNGPNVSKDALNFGSGARGSPYKKGGKVHDDVAADKALIKKMVKPEARTARATGGRSGKGKTNVNIVIAAGKPAGAGDMGMNPMGGPTKPPGMDGAPGGIPVQVPPPATGGAPMPMPMPMPGPAGPPGPPGMPPMPRKSGGRTYRSYKDMDAGAGSGKGRLEKTEIQSRK